MKRFLTALVASAMILVGCSTTENSLLNWVREAGMAVVIENTSAALSDVASGLDGLGTSPEDIKTMVTTLQTSAKALTAQVAALTAEPTSNDAAYEQLRQDLITSMQSYIDAAQQLDAEQIIKTGNIAATTAVVNALTEISAKLLALSDYLEANGENPVTAA